MGLRAQAKAMSRTHGPSEMKGLNTVGRRIRQMTQLICNSIFQEGDKDTVGLEALCDTFGIETTTNTASGIIQVLLRVCRRDVRVRPYCVPPINFHSGNYILQI